VSTDRTEILNQIKQTVKATDPGAEVILFGSRARGDFNSESDWDLIVLLNKQTIDFIDKRKIRRNLFQVELDFGQPLSVFVYSSQEWHQTHRNTPFFQAIKKEGLQL